MSDNKKSAESVFTNVLINKINLFEFSSDYKLKRKICDILRTNGKQILNLSSVLSKDNFFKYDYKNIKEALGDIFLEKDIFSFHPLFKLSKEYEEDIFNKNIIEFDICITFNENCIKKEALELLEILNDSVKDVSENNKNIAAYYLYRIMKEERCYFYPVELLINKLLASDYFEYSLNELFRFFLKRDYYETTDNDVYEALKCELFLMKENSFLNFAQISGEESLYLNQSEIEELIGFDLKAKEIKIIFLRQNLRFNIKHNSLMEEIINYFKDFLLNNNHITTLIQKNLPPDKKHFLDNIDIFNFDEIIRTVIDRKFLANYHLPDKYKKEFFIIAQYISENQKFFLDNIELSNAEENFSKDLREEIKEELKNFLNNIIAKIIIQKKEINFIFSYSDFLSILYKSIKKDKNIVLRIFNNEIKNKYCFFMYFKLNEESEEIEFFNNPVESQVIIIPLNLLKEIAVILIKSEFNKFYDFKNYIFIFINVLKLILKKPQIINIDPESPESIKPTGFYNKKDMRDIIDLLETKYDNIKDIIREEEIILLKQKETDRLKKHKIFNSLRIAILFFQKIILRDKYYKNLKSLNDHFEEKLIDKEIMDQKDKKKIIRLNKEFKTDEYESERKRIAGIIENMDDDERRLFTNIYNCLKNKGSVEYEYRDKKLNVEIYLKTSSIEKSPQMYISRSETLHSLITLNVLMLDRKYIRLTDRIKKYFGLG